MNCGIARDITRVLKHEKSSTIEELSPPKCPPLAQTYSLFAVIEREFLFLR